MPERIMKSLKKRNILERRTILYLSLFLFFFAVLLAVWLITASEKTILRNEKNNIKFVAKELAQNFEIIFNDLYLTGINLNGSIKQRIVDDKDSERIEINSFLHKKQKGEPLRIDNGISGSYLAAGTDYNDKIGKYFFFSQRIFEVISSIAKTHFFNFYFITEDNFICITPKDWALELEPDHDFSEDVFYKIGMPENNPERTGRWTPIYYDSIWKKWMTSLIVPIYKEEQFIGITGSDIFLEDIFKYILDVNKENVMYNAVIFDDTGNLIAHKDFMEQIYQSSGEMNTLLSLDTLDNPSLQSIITNSIEKNRAKSNVKRIKTEDGIYFSTTYKIPRIGWNLAIYVAKSDIMRNSNGVIIKILLIITFSGLLFLFVIRLYLKKFFLKRITMLGIALKKVEKGELNTKVVVNSKDEIGLLEKGFVRMQRSLLTKFEELGLAKAEIQESQQRYKTYIENAPYGIFITDEKGKYTMVNKAAAEISEYTEEELLKLSVPDLLTENSLAEGLEHFTRAQKIGSSSGELEYKTKYGKVKMWSVDAVKLTENSYIGFVMDISERKNNEAELNRYKENLEEMVKERTVQLTEKNEKLEHFNQLFVGREFRIKELREKLKKLESDSK